MAKYMQVLSNRYDSRPFGIHQQRRRRTPREQSEDPPPTTPPLRERTESTKPTTYNSTSPQQVISSSPRHRIDETNVTPSPEILRSNYTTMQHLPTTDRKPTPETTSIPPIIARQNRHREYDRFLIILTQQHTSHRTAREVKIIPLAS